MFEMALCSKAATVMIEQEEIDPLLYSQCVTTIYFRMASVDASLT